VSPGAGAVDALRVAGVVRVFAPARGAHRRRGGTIPREPVIAVDDVTLTVPAGRVMGLLGPNGAGKTTLLRMICALLPPTRGRIEVLGIDAARDPAAVRGRIGVLLGGERSMYWRLTARENLWYAGALYGVPGGIARARAEGLLEWVGLAARADDLVETFSTGLRLRLGIARALIHDPALLILDEPTAGLDPHAVLAIHAMLRELSGQGGRAVVLATHNIAEAERLSDLVAVLDRGRLAAFGTPSEVAAAAAGSGSRPRTLEDAFLDLTDAGRAAAAVRPT
jgi:ABC-2 type transport system ATP-binding protein